MNFTFTKENVELYWKILNTSQSKDEKKMADEYLIAFKKSPQAIDICLQLFENNDQVSQFLAAIIIHQILKERINEIIEKKEDFYRFRDLLVNNLLEKLKKSAGYVIERICFSISILVAMGVITYWPESIEDIIAYGKTSKENCYFSLIILENVNKELFELNISAKTLLRIKDMLIDRNRFIQEFIFLVMTNVGAGEGSQNMQSSLSPEEAKVNNQLFNKTLELTHAWIKLGLNVLKIPLLSQTLITYLSVDNIKQISDIFSDSIHCSTNSKYYSVNDIYEIDGILEKYDKEEFQSVENLIEMIKNSMMTLTDQNENYIEILDGLANIFSSILENFINLLFLKNTLSSTLGEMLYSFISHKNRKISLKFVETISEMREFINRGYKFNNFNNPEKLEFCNFLIKICESVMTNSTMKILPLNESLMKSKENLMIEDMELMQALGNTGGDIDSDLDEKVPLSEYRKNADDVFYNIFLILTYNFEENGAQFFFEWLNNILAKLNINDESIATDESRLVLVEVTMMVVKSVLDSMDISDFNSRHVLQFTSLLLNSKILMNDKMVLTFLIYLDLACTFIPKDQGLFQNIVIFLIDISKVKLLENISTYILLETTDFLSTPNIECFRTMYNYYQESFDSLSPIATGYLCDALCNVVGVLDKNDKVLVGVSEQEVIHYFTFILQPATDRLQKTYQFIITNLGENSNVNPVETFSEPDYNKIKLELLKNFNVHNAVLKKSYFLTKSILRGAFAIHVKDTLSISESIFKLFVKDSYVIQQISKIYSKVIHHLGEELIEYFDKFNDMMLNAYLNNPENLTCLVVLKLLYSDGAKSSQEKKTYISETFMNLCEIIIKNVFSMKKNQVELIDTLAQFLIKVLETVDYLATNPDIFNNLINLFLESLKTVAEPSMNKNVIRAITRIISENKISKEIIFPKFTEIVFTVFVSCDHYESTSMPDFNNFAIACLEFEENSFINTLVEVFSQSKFKVFKKEHVEIILKYLTTIGKNDKNVKPLLNDITNITKGMGQTESLMQYAMALAHWERKQKMGGVGK